MLAALLREAEKRGVKTIYGYYRRTAKNAMTAELYRRYGFAPQDGAGEVWRADLGAVRIEQPLAMLVEYGE